MADTAECEIFNDQWADASMHMKQVRAMLRRIQSWKAIFEFLEWHMSEVYQAESHYLQSYQNLTRRRLVVEDPSAFGENVLASLNLLHSQDAIKADKHLLVVDQLNNMILPQLSSLKSDVTRFYADVEKEIMRLLNMLIESRRSLVFLIRNFEQEYAKVQSQHAHANGAVMSGHPNGDPWLIEGKLKLQQQKLSIEENMFHQAKFGMFEEVQKADLFYSESLQSLLDPFAVVSAALAEECQTIVTDMKHKIDGINPTAIFGGFQESSKLSLQTLNISSLERQYNMKNGPLAQIVSKTVLYRRVGTMRWTWKKTLVIVTAAQYLYCYDCDPQTSFDVPTIVTMLKDLSPMSGLSRLTDRSPDVRKLVFPDPHIVQESLSMESLTEPEVAISLLGTRVEVMSLNTLFYGVQNAATYNDTPICAIEINIPNASRFSVNSQRIALLFPNKQEREAWLVLLQERAIVGHPVVSETLSSSGLEDYLMVNTN